MFHHRRTSSRRPSIAAVSIAVVAATTLGTSFAISASASPDVHRSPGGTARQSAAGKAPKAGFNANFTIANNVAFDGDPRTYDLGSDRTGKSYLAWISAPTVNPMGQSREIHFCTLTLHATSCSATQTVASPGSAPVGLRELVSPAGLVTILWYYDSTGAGHIAEVTSQSGGPLSAITDFAAAPNDGTLLDAEFGPGGTIWTVAHASGGPLEIRDGPSGTKFDRATSYNVGSAQLAFSGSTPIIAIGDLTSISSPGVFTYEKSGAFTPLAPIAHTWQDGTTLGLTSTPRGVFVTTGVDSAGYTGVMARWDGHGFSKPLPTGDLKSDGSSCSPNSHATVTDSTGRLVQATAECSTKVTVSNLGTSKNSAAIISTPIGGTYAGGRPQVTTLPRGYGWAAWSNYSDSNTADGERLKVASFRLAGLHATKTGHGSHGKVTLTGPATCLPADAISVSAKGHASHGWKAGKGTLKLGHKKQGATLNGAALTPNKTYTLTGSVVFSDHQKHQTVKAKLTFRSCPNP